MGIPSELRDLYASRQTSLLIQSPQEDAKMLRSKMCTQEGVRAGAKAAAIACVASAVPTLIVCRKVPWAKANINHTGQALIISAASIAAYFITADKTILECARRNTHYKPS
ncbi:early nodulin-93-like [Salvia divinorum]|uniref:Early nodulin-93-like n=1 Tax=Salvia divinorum TaxID=28513 RepID=A0ABD1FL51_SALDI